jgi:hypothetical protein
MIASSLDAFVVVSMSVVSITFRLVGEKKCVRVCLFFR